MGLFQKCAIITNSFAIIEQIAQDGIAYISPYRECAQRKINMHLREVTEGIVVCNQEEIDLTDWISYFCDYPFLKISDSKSDYIKVRLSGNFKRMEHDNALYIMLPNTIRLMIDITGIAC